MNSLPLLSHHLFAAAAGHKEHLLRPARRDELPPLTVEDRAPAVPLEVLDASEPMPVGATRPLRGAAVLSES